MLSVDSTTASELAAAEMGWAAWPYLVGGRVADPWVRSIRARRVGDRQPAAARFGRWLLAAAFIRLGVYLLQRCGLLAATG
jgi:hypothetical protein